MDSLITSTPSTILITGGGGYLGSKLAERLAKKTSNIFLLDVQFNILSKKLIAAHKKIHQVSVDLNDFGQLNQIIRQIRPETVFHFAALLNRQRDFSLYPELYNINVGCTLNLLNALIPIDYKGLYFASTSEIYGNSEDVPLRESQIPNPTSPYSLTKLMAENLIRTFSEIHNKPFTIFRIFNFYGNGMPESFFLSQLINTLKRGEKFKMTAGEQIRDFLFIDELTELIYKLSESPDCKNENINLCSGTGIAIKDMAQIIARKLNQEQLLQLGALPYRNNEIWNMVGSNEKLKRILQDYKLRSLTENLDQII